jgi:CPA1 family monovalent cation:H+ antiporter
LIQGLTLRPLILALKFEEDDPVAREAAQARCIAYRAALGAIEADPSEEAEILRLEYRAVLLRAETEPELGVASSELPADPLRRRAIAAAREALLRMRQLEEISDDAFHQVEEELDRAELGAQA